jgi:hypothetical protein
MNERIRGMAEVEIVHRDALGNIKSVEKKTSPVTYRDSPQGPIDIKEA